jgi:hypothetical protein
MLGKAKSQAPHLEPQIRDMMTSMIGHDDSCQANLLVSMGL